MPANKNDKTYTAADIRQYLEGKLPEPAMHAMEKAALDDPFLADAMEGMETRMHEGRLMSFDEDMRDLEDRLTAKTTRKEKTMLLFPGNRWIKLAAASVIILGLGTLAFLLTGKTNTSTKDIAITRPAPSSSDSIVVKNGSAIAKPTEPSVSDDRIAVEKKKEKYANADKTLHRNTKANTKIKNVLNMRDTLHDLADNSDETVVQKKPAVSVAAVKDPATAISDSNLSPTISAKSDIVTVKKTLAGKAAGVDISRNAKANNTQAFQGRVIDANRQPVTGASVIYNNTRNGTTTDKNGAFNLNTTSRDTVASVLVNAIGYQSVSAAVNSNDTSVNTIQLQPSTNTLNEVVVIGYGTRKKEEEDADKATPATANEKDKTLEQLAAPTIGWEAFNTYIEKNKKIVTSDSSRSGKEIVSFIVRKNGVLSDFTISQSLSPAHNAEAIRLIKEGPSWKLLKGKKSKATVIITF